MVSKDIFQLVLSGGMLITFAFLFVCILYIMEIGMNKANVWIINKDTEALESMGRQIDIQKEIITRLSADATECVARTNSISPYNASKILEEWEELKFKEKLHEKKA